MSGLRVKICVFSLVQSACQLSDQKLKLLFIKVIKYFTFSDFSSVAGFSAGPGRENPKNGTAVVRFGFGSALSGERPTVKALSDHE
jgi:hypothetical protein